MRRIIIPHDAMLAATAPIGSQHYDGTHVLLPVQVDWPELQLTDAQKMANIVALANGRRTPFPDPSIFHVQIPRVPFSIRG